MQPLKDFLSKGFSRTVAILNVVSFVVLLIAVFLISFLHSSDQLKRNVTSSAKAISGYLFAGEISSISEYVNTLGRSGAYSYIVVKDRINGEAIIEASFGKPPLIPSICSDKVQSDIIELKACTSVITINSFIMLVLFIFIYIVCLGLIHALLKSQTLAMFQVLTEELTTGKSSTVQILEFAIIKETLEKRSAEVGELSRQAAVANISRQIAHDIRSPLYTISNVLKMKDINSSSFDVVLKSIERLDQLAHHLLSATKNSKTLNLPGKRRIDISAAVDSLVKSKLLEHPDKNLKIHIQVSEKCFLWFNNSTFCGMISNCLNNSIEAGASEIRISFNGIIENNEVSAVLEDNGSGFSDQFFENLEHGKVISQKEYGHGIGLNSLIGSINANGGNVKFSNHFAGARIEISFGKSSLVRADLPIVLIDDDKYIRFSWELNANRLGIPIFLFSSADEFMKVENSIPRDAELFIDSDLGGVNGEDLVEELFEKGFQKITIQTGKAPEEFENLSSLNDIISKTFPY